VYSRYSKAAIDQSNDPDSDYWVAMNKYFNADTAAPKGAATVDWAILGPICGYVLLFALMKLYGKIFRHADLKKRAEAHEETVLRRERGGSATTVEVDSRLSHARYFSQDYVTREEEIAKSFAAAHANKMEHHTELYANGPEFLGLTNEVHALHNLVHVQHLNQKMLLQHVASLVAGVAGGGHEERTVINKDALASLANAGSEELKEDARNKLASVVQVRAVDEDGGGGELECHV
jgi:hypothetical protein